MMRDLNDLAQMHDLSHDNLNTFIGICVRDNIDYIMSKYCSKGSLQVCIHHTMYTQCLVVVHFGFSLIVIASRLYIYIYNLHLNLK